MEKTETKQYSYLLTLFTPDGVFKGYVGGTRQNQVISTDRGKAVVYVGEEQKAKGKSEARAIATGLWVKPFALANK